MFSAAICSCLLEVYILLTSVNAEVVDTYKRRVALEVNQTILIKDSGHYW